MVPPAEEEELVVKTTALSQRQTAFTPALACQRMSVPRQVVGSNQGLGRGSNL